MMHSDYNKIDQAKITYTKPDPDRNSFNVSVIALIVSMLSVIIAGLTVYFTQTKEIKVDLKGATRDWQKGAVFSTLLSSSKPLNIEEIEAKYRSVASAYRDQFNLSDRNYSREEIYGVLLDLMNGQAIKLRDNKYFAVRADDDNMQDRRIAFDMLEFVLRNEFKYQYDEFASQFANWYFQTKGDPLSKERALGVLAIAFQSNLLGLRVQPGFRIDCAAVGEVPTLYVSSSFAIRTGAPTLLPMPAAVPPCPPKQ